MPLTRLSALRHGSSRYSTATEVVYEHMFVHVHEVGSFLPHPRASFLVTLTAGGGWNLSPHPGGELWAEREGPVPPLYSESAWTTTTRLVPAPRRAERDSLLSAACRLRPAAPERSFRRGRVRARHGTPDAYHRAPRPGQQARSTRPPDHDQPATVHRRDADRRNAHEPGHR